MSSFNKVFIIGNVGTEPEMRFTPNGSAVASFSVAVNDKRGGEDVTEWFNIVTWNKLAENCNQYLEKGRQVFVDGRLQTRKWEGQDGITHYKTEVHANKVLFLGSKNKTEESTDIVPDDYPFE
uniref:Putative single-stranded DNA-binding protein n=1 Tax=viral metagenome TaxID=1070528 RepID=A0A6M3LBS6_9ZZZZ